MVNRKEDLSAKRVKIAKKLMQNKAGNLKTSRIQQQIQSDLSPKFTEMKTGARTSRYGRPQVETKQEASSIPTEIAKFIPKHSPKRLKPKDTEVQSTEINVEDQEQMTDQAQVKEAAPETEDSSPPIEKENIPEQELTQEENDGDVYKIAPDDLPEAEVDTFIMAVDGEPVEDQHVPDESSINVYANEGLADSGKEPSEPNKDEDSDASMSEKGKHDFSDTDSALGSTTSCTDAKQNFIAGQILWGSYSRKSWFPCMSYPHDDEGNIMKSTGKQKMINVKYFNWRGYQAFLPVKNVFEFTDIDHFNKQITALNVNKKSMKPFSKSCNKAIEEANFFKQYSVVERVKIFDEVLCHQLQPKGRKLLEINRGPSTSQMTARKSVDSAHESSASPTPSSPHYDHAKSDPIASYEQAMQRYEANLNNNNEVFRPKRERKTSLTRAAVKIETERGSQKEDSNRRRSTRPIKKRKFEDFEQEVRAEANRSELVASPSIEPKAKRAKVVKEETLEERFVIPTETLRASCRSNRKKRVCMACLQPDEDPTFKCTGNGDVKCAGWYHERCSGRFEVKREEVRHQCGDSDELFQTQAMITVLMCKTCSLSMRNCFVCTMPVELEEADETLHCPNQDCRLTFHASCLKMWPQNKLSKGNNKRSNQCPQHLCHTCFSKGIHNTGPLMKCMKCPAAYHMQHCCIPAGTQVLSQLQVICPRHPTEKELQRNLKDKNAKPLNIDFCQICSENGNLVCCEACPNAFHTECIDNEDTDDSYFCRECQEGRLPLYYNIVWARVGAYRWWPGLIMIDSVVPEVAMKFKKCEREFCVRFFGSYDYFWFTCEKVFAYDGSNISMKGGSSRLDSAFNVALEEAEQLAAVLAMSDQQSSKPKPYIKIQQNRPVPPVKLKKMDEHMQPCNCKATDPTPCAKDSDCINMHLNLECNKAFCPAGDNCQNQKIRNREYMDLKLVKTANRGFGVVSVKDVTEGAFVIEYVGELIDTAEVNKRMSEKMKNKDKEFYFLTIEADLFVDAEPAGNMARFINHSCEPNCRSRKVIVDGNTRIGIFTNQSIKAGTELTFDYQMVFAGKEKTPCFCGAPKCSGWIGEKPKEEKKVSEKSGKKKIKRKPTKASQPKRRRTTEDTIDPFEALMEKLPEKFADKSKARKPLGARTPSQSTEIKLHAVDFLEVEVKDEVKASDEAQIEDEKFDPDETFVDPFIMLFSDNDGSAAAADAE